MYNTVAGNILWAVKRFCGWLERCVPDLCDRLGFIIETRGHDASPNRADGSHRSDTRTVQYWFHRLRMI